MRTAARPRFSFATLLALILSASPVLAASDSPQEAAAAPESADRGLWIAPEPTGRERLEARVLSAEPPPPPPPRVDSKGMVPLSLQQAVELAVVHHLGLQGSRLERASAEERIGQSRGAFDPVMNGLWRHDKNVSPSASQLNATISADNSDLYTVGLTQKLWYGATYDVGVQARRQETNNPFVIATPTYSTDLTLKYTQPLLRGFGRDANRAAIAQAINSEMIARHNVETTARQIVRETIVAYWDLVFAQGDLEVRRSSLGLAKELLRKNKIMVEVGTLAPLEITQAEASVADRDLQIIVAEHSVGGAEDNLRRLIGVPEDSPWWDARIVPTDSPEYRAFTATLEDAMRTAMERRPEIPAAQLQVENAKLGVAAAKDALLPQLSFELSGSSAGLDGDRWIDTDPLVDSDGDGNPVDDQDLRVDGNVGDAFDQSTSHDFESYSASLIWSQPLRNRAAEGQYLVERLALETARLQLAELRQSITLEVRKAIRDLDGSRESVTSAVAARKLQEKKLDAEVKKFENGLSTNFEVLQFQTDLQSASSAELKALTDYLKSQAELKDARGTLLDDYGLVALR